MTTVGSLDRAAVDSRDGSFIDSIGTPLADGTSAPIVARTPAVDDRAEDAISGGARCRPTCGTASKGKIGTFWSPDRMAARDRFDDPGAYVQPSQQAGTAAWWSPSCETNRATTAAPEGDAVLSEVNGSDPRARELVRVAVVDDHAAIRIGLTSALASQPGLVCVGVAADGEELQPLLHRTRPHVVVLDYHLPRVNGLELCRRIKSDVLAPAVLLYSAYADPALVVPARVAGADGIVHKGSPARELFEAIRVVAGGGTQMPPLIPELLAAARAALDVQDRRVLDLLVEWTPRWEIAAALGVPIPEIDERSGEIIARLRDGMARPGSVEL